MRREKYRREDDDPHDPPGSDFGQGKTIVVLAIVVGCFAILWPKIFYPMLFGETSTEKQEEPVIGGETQLRPTVAYITITLGMVKDSEYCNCNNLFGRDLFAGLWVAAHR